MAQRIARSVIAGSLLASLVGRVLFGENFSAISRLVYPIATRERISRSRGVRRNAPRPASSGEAGPDYGDAASNRSGSTRCRGALGWLGHGPGQADL